MGQIRYPFVMNNAIQNLSTATTGANFYFEVPRPFASRFKSDYNLFDLAGSSRTKRLEVRQPILTNEDLEKIRAITQVADNHFKSITLDMASVGYGETIVLQKLNLRIDPDDRIALLGRNGNGKTTLARLLAAQLAPMAGEVHASGKMRVGYFTQYQVEELHGDDTPLQHMSRAMTGKTPGAVRAQLGRFGFSGDKAMTRVDKLSGSTAMTARSFSSATIATWLS